MSRRINASLVASLLTLAAPASMAATFYLEKGNGNCPTARYPATLNIAMTYKEEACTKLLPNSSARLAEGGVISNVGGWCHVKHQTTAPQTSTLCYSMPMQVTDKDNSCPGGRLVTVEEAALFFSAARVVADQKGQWLVARLADGGSMGGSGHNYAVKATDTGGITNSLCTKDPVIERSN